MDEVLDELFVLNPVDLAHVAPVVKEHDDFFDLLVVKTHERLADRLPKERGVFERALRGVVRNRDPAEPERVIAFHQLRCFPN